MIWKPSPRRARLERDIARAKEREQTLMDVKAAVLLVYATIATVREYLDEVEVELRWPAGEIRAEEGLSDA